MLFLNVCTVHNTETTSLCCMPTQYVQLQVNVSECRMYMYMTCLTHTHTTHNNKTAAGPTRAVGMLKYLPL